MAKVQEMYLILSNYETFKGSFEREIVQDSSLSALNRRGENRQSADSRDYMTIHAAVGVLCGLGALSFGSSGQSPSLVDLQECENRVTDSQVSDSAPIISSEPESLRYQTALRIQVLHVAAIALRDDPTWLIAPFVSHIC